MRRDVILLIFAVIIISLRYVTSKADYKDNDRIRITAKITSEPVRYSKSQYLTIESLRFYLPKYPEVGYGDEIVVEGIVEGRKLNKTQLISVKTSEKFLPKLRNNIIDFIRTSLPEPHSSLVAGVVLGSKSSIPSDFWASLKYTGTAHVVVASGMNVTLVAGFLISILVILIPRRKAVPLALVGIWLYAMISGFDAPIIRAAIMGSIAFSAVTFGRINFAWRALLFSAFFMLFFKPLWIVDHGFILSFVATASLMLFEKPIENRLKYFPSFLRKNFATSLAAQIGVAPILYATFGQFNIFSPLINALVLWTIAPITIIGMIACLAGLVWDGLAKLILYLSFPLTFWFVRVVELFS